jgi:glutamate racemase
MDDLPKPVETGGRILRRPAYPAGGTGHGGRHLRFGAGRADGADARARRLPDVPFVYFGDNAHAPYGVRDADDIFALTCAGVERLWAEGCDLVILACNTASAAALRRMQETWVPADKRVLGVFVPLIEALTERQWGDNSPPREVAVKHVALFATPATVSSRAFQRELAFRAIGVDVEAQPCGGVVDAIEEGDMIWPRRWSHSHVAALKRRMPHPQAAVLGCTHYPLLEDAFQPRWGPRSRSIRRPTWWPKAWPTT